LKNGGEERRSSVFLHISKCFGAEVAFTVLDRFERIFERIVFLFLIQTNIRRVPQKGYERAIEIITYFFGRELSLGEPQIF